MTAVVIFIVGAIFGAALVFVISSVTRKKSEEELARKQEESEKVLKAAFYEVAKDLPEQVITVARQVLDSKTTETSKDLESKKNLIDQSLTTIQNDLKERLEKVQNLMTEINKSVPEKYGEVSTAIGNIAKQSENLRQTTETLRIALSGSQQRGQWGERIAEDILRLMGMVEGVEYIKQRQIEGGRSRPDFTFILPENLKVNMDVKFPWDKYQEYTNVDGEIEKESAKRIFLSSVRARIKEVTTRDYINPDDNTVDSSYDDIAKGVFPD